MAFFRGDIKSSELGMDTAINVILPNDYAEANANACKVLFLLHGHSDNASAWFRNTRIEYYPRQYNLAVIIPEVQRSFYTDMEYGLKYFSYVSDELPKICRNLFRLSDKREDTMVAGLSMGGYGALKCAFSRPDLFSKCGAFSSAIDMNQRFIGKDDAWQKELTGVFGEKVKPRDDLYALTNALAQRQECQKPEFFVTCGSEDFLHEENIKFKEFMETQPFQYSYLEWEGTHEWGFWDESVKLMLKRFLG